MLRGAEYNVDVQVAKPSSALIPILKTIFHPTDRKPVVEGLIEQLHSLQHTGCIVRHEGCSQQIQQEVAAPAVRAASLLDCALWFLDAFKSAPRWNFEATSRKQCQFSLGRGVRER